MRKEFVKAANAQLVNDLLLEAEDRPESITNSMGVIVTRAGKLLGNGHPVTVKYFENSFYTKIEVCLEGQAGFILDIQGSGFQESELLTYIKGVHLIALERSNAK